MEYFAHAGEDDAAEHAASGLPPELAAAAIAIACLAALWLITTYVFKWSFGTRIMLVMAALLVTGVLTFGSAPITATVAVTLGMTITLGGTLLQLGAKPRK